MYPIKYYYPHKIIYLLVILFKVPNILLLTLVFVYFFTMLSLVLDFSKVNLKNV
jgi:hypothetical protein